MCGWTTAILFSWISQKIDEGESVSKTVQRKVWNSIGKRENIVIINLTITIIMYSTSSSNTRTICSISQEISINNTHLKTVDQEKFDKKMKKSDGVVEVREVQVLEGDGGGI